MFRPHRGVGPKSHRVAPDDGRILKKRNCRCHIVVVVVVAVGGVMWRAIEAILLPRPIRHRRCCITIYKQLRGELHHENWRREESIIRDETVSHCMRARYSRLLRKPGVFLSRRNGRLLSTGLSRGTSGLLGAISLLLLVGYLKFSHAFPCRRQLGHSQTDAMHDNLRS